MLIICHKASAVTPSATNPPILKKPGMGNDDQQLLIKAGMVIDVVISKIKSLKLSGSAIAFIHPFLNSSNLDGSLVLGTGR